MKPAPPLAHEADRLRVVRELRILAAEADPALDAIVRIAALQCGRPMAAIALVDADRLAFAAAAGLSLREAPRSGAPCADAIVSDAPLQVSDAGADPRYAAHPLVTRAPLVRGCAAVPITVDGQRVGTLCAIDTAPGLLDAPALDALRDLARVTEELLDARLHAQRWHRQEAQVRGASRAGNHTPWESDADGVHLLQHAVEAESAPSLTVVDATRPDLPLVYVNHAFERLTGYARAEVLGRNCRFLQQGGNAQQPALASLRDALANGRSCSLTLHNWRKDGTLFVNELHVAPVNDAAGRVTHYIGVQSDATERTRAAERLALSEARWKFALDGAGDGVWDYDEDTRTAFFSPTWKRMLGHDESEIGPDLEEWWSRVHPDDRNRVVDAFHRYRHGAARDYDLQYRLRHKEGHSIWVRDRGRIVERRPDGSARRLVGVHSDITHQRLADQALRDKQAAELASRAKSEFLSRMSHEMRTPLNAVIGFTQLLRLQGPNDRQRLAQYSEHILQAGEHLLSLVNDVLDLQQVEEGRLSLQLVPVVLHEVLEQAFELTRPLARPRGIDLRSELPSNLLVRADAQRLRQVLLNVLSNSVKYNRDAGSVRCAVEAGPAGRVVLLVEDSGRGLDREQLARLFQPFERLGLESSGIEGSGLGLIIARQLMREMRGDLRLSSRAGIGTQVRLDLPLGPAPQVSAAPPAHVEAQTTTDWSETIVAALPAEAVPLRMLYVEDNRINALLFEEAIKLRGGVELRIAEDGEEALQLVAQWTPEVLVLDAHLPGMSGFELLLALRQRPALDAAPAFMCSADAMPDDLERAKTAGFVGYWSKPIDISRVMKDLDALRPGLAKPPAAG